ncbi:MAG: choice-of-anchor D domain-containing protein [Gammaproteobacteria bacterium]
MKSFIHTFFIAVLAGLLAFTAQRAQADSVPDVLHYKFNGTGTSVPNLASAPPASTTTATIMGGLTQTGTDLNVGGGGFSLVGSGVSAATDYLNTGWAPNLGAGSWTISFITSNITASATLFYIFGDANTATFRCFTNGVAGANNWILRGAGLTDVTVSGGATVATHRTTFVYDNTLNNVKGYLDGVLVTTVAQTAPNLTGAGPFKVVGYGSNVGAPAGGLLDDFRVYSRALSAAEVQDIDKQPILAVTGNAVTIANGDSTPDTADHTDFGSVSLGSTFNRTFTITNNGNLDLTLGTVTVGGTHAADFTVALQPTTPLSASGNTSFQVTFNPSAVGLRSATLSFSNNDADDNPFSFAIQGTGVNTAPTISDVADQTIAEDANTGAIAVTIGDAETAAGSLALTGDSSNTTLVPNANLVFGGSDANRTVTVTPAANLSGTSTITLTVTDGGGMTATDTFLLTVNSVNDVPSFTKGPDQTVNEDAGAQTVTNWATNMSAGPADEAGQTLSFQVTNNTNAALFSVAPAVSPSGVLTYTPAADANGTATISLVINDSGGTADGGVDTSAVQTFTITVNAANDAPSFTKGPNQTINENAGAQSIANWATNLSQGPANEAAQTLSFKSPTTLTPRCLPFNPP